MRHLNAFFDVVTNWIQRMRQRESFKMIASSFIYLFVFNLGDKKNAATNSKKMVKKGSTFSKKIFLIGCEMMLSLRRIPMKIKLEG